MTRSSRNPSSRSTSPRTPEASVYVYSTFNNTLVQLTRPSGSTLAWSSGGRQGFKGSRRSTAYSAQRSGEALGREALRQGIHRVHLYLRGMGKGRYAVAKGLRTAGLRVSSLTDLSPLAFNGCRPPRRRRV